MQKKETYRGGGSLALRPRVLDFAPEKVRELWRDGKNVCARVCMRVPAEKDEMRNAIAPSESAKRDRKNEPGKSQKRERIAPAEKRKIPNTHL